MVKDSLNNLVNERSIAESRSTLSLILAVLLKYGIAPLACIYFAWLISQKDEVIQKNNDTLVTIVREQTTATTQNTVALQGLNTVIQTYNNKLDKVEEGIKEERRNTR